MRLPALTLSSLLAALVALPVSAAPTPITLDQAMSNPDWIGTPVEAAWWSWDGKQVYYKQKRDGSPVRDTYQAVAGKPRLVADADLGKIDSGDVVYDREHKRMLVLKNGDLFERDLKGGALTQITRGAARIEALQYSSDERAVQYRIGSDWFVWDRASKVVGPAALPRAAKDPNAPEDDSYRATELRLIAHLQRQKDERDALRARGDELRRVDGSMVTLSPK
jgi:hypothetical protein